MSGQGAKPGATSAAGPALGFTCQIEMALLLLLQRMPYEEYVSLSIETADDIVIDTSTKRDSFQIKHSVNPNKSLTDASTDLWKTLYNWIGDSSGVTNRTLLTTATAARDSGVASLRAGADRDVRVAHSRLEKAAKDSNSETNASFCKTFLSLPRSQRLELLDTVYVLDDSTSADDMSRSLATAVRTSVRPQYRTALVERLRGWWIGRAQEHLLAVARGQPSELTSDEVMAQVNDLVQDFRDSRLPIDDLDIERPDLSTVQQDERIFVEQLRAIKAGDRRLRLSVYDHNRAAAQRSSWQRERLLNLGELSRFDSKLKDEWEHFFAWVDDECGSDDDACRRALDSFDSMQKASLPRIRQEVEEKYIATGSLHMLADQLTIGWHPQWDEKFSEREHEARETPQGDGSS